MIAAGLHAYFEAYIAESERLLAEIDPGGFYKHLKRTLGVEVTKSRSEQYIRDEDGTFLRDKVRPCERWLGFCDKPLITKLVKLDPTIIDLLSPRPLKLSLEDEPSMDEMAGALKGMPNWKAVGPDGLPGELLKTEHSAFAQCFHNILVNVRVKTEVPQQWKDALIKVLHNKKAELTATTAEGFRLSPTKAKFC